MCGIAGIVSLRPGLEPPSLEALGAMAALLRHRGPDEFGLYRDAQAGLAHARLSIIDLATGQQPLANETNELWVVFNGEIFNYVELRDELVALGHAFRTRSDTEVIVHAYEAWGEGAFARFNGQFAIALWDAKTRRAVFARDRLGVRPLYLCEHGGRLYFASEVRAIFGADPSIPRAFDPFGIEQTFTFWTVVPPQSVFAGVRELEPGCVRTYEEGGRVRDVRFWRPRYPEGGEGGFRGSIGEAAEAVRAALEDATRLRMLRADVPVGSYLSGGLDSSLVAALGRQVKGERFQTFSLRFADHEYDETEFQRLMVARLGTEHREVMVSRRDIAEVFPEAVERAERPLLRTAPAPLLLLSRLVREAGVKVVLTGEGADEMFAGYDLFREGTVRRFWARQPKSTLRPLLLQRLYPYLARSPVAQQALARQFFGRDLARASEPGFAHGTRWHTTGALKRLLSPALRERVAGRDVIAELLATLPPEFARWAPLAQDQFLEVKTLLGGYLLSSQGDRMLMANSVEGRFPFLDPRVVELANALPASYKIRVLDEKHVLKRAAEGLVPPEIVRRPKQPYRAPDALSFVGDDAPAWVAAAASAEAASAAGVFDPAAVERLWAKCRRAQGDQLSNADNMALVGVLSTHLLYEQLVRRAPAPERSVHFTTLVDRLAPG
ncbi:MAG: asparagine synthase (glutamine-hydrolyzing) [Polyangiaceae bacterium]|nr:asparagine synthase (glutamine-hydrolyzing) [Polyangiaceae bacterium]